MKREHLIQAALVVLSVLFVGACAMVFLTRGSPCSLRWKLRLGGLILHLSAMVACGTLAPYEPEMTCYAVGPGNPNTMAITSPAPTYDTSAHAVSIPLGKAPHELKGNVHERQGNAFSFRLCEGYGGDNAGATPSCVGKPEVQRENITAVDGSWDEFTEEFQVMLPDGLRGEYTLELFATDEASMDLGGTNRMTYKVVATDTEDPPR